MSLYILGVILKGLSIISIFPLLCDVIDDNKDIYLFLSFALISMVIGCILSFSFKPKTSTLKFNQIFFLTSFIWVGLPLIAAIPIYLNINTSYVDAVFETVSAVTTTGATVITSLADTDSSILLWRSMLQWLGGVGFVAFAVAILPLFNLNSMQLFQSEVSGTAMKITPKFTDTVKKIIILYFGLTISCCLCYWLAGMTCFQAVNHAFTTVSTGGYSVFDDSIGHYKNNTIYLVSTFFMITASLPFVSLVKAFAINKLNIFTDEQINFFLSFLLFFYFITTVYLTLNHEYSWQNAFVYAAFSITSIVTTTGYVIVDYSQWGDFILGLFCLFLIIGGCTGSTAGGLKMQRVQIFLRICTINIKKTLHPEAVVDLRYNNQDINNEIIFSLIGFLVAYIITIFIIGLFLCLDGIDFVTSFSSSAMAVGNVGTGLGSIVGPAGNFKSLSNFAKWLLSFGMLLGRLEVIALIATLIPSINRR